ncbi:MAG: DUF5110 domain-containing protein [Bacteroides sp.]|nr:DUF5110 domain-containing protein [Bacteroides sp.]MCM1378561.1 DUF5110 domain-containing protein [Bacteroides sp.]MCM1444862.1 DUF5110 domain-containing protein [Prevotella sp.]
MRNFYSVLAAVAATLTSVSVQAETTAKALNPTTVEVALDGDSSPLVIDFYSPNIFRVFQDPQGGIVRDPQATPPALILVDSPRVCPGQVTVNKEGGNITISSARIKLTFPADGKTFSVTDLQTGKTVVKSLKPIEYTAKNTTLALSEEPDEYFYGGGVQNGRFSHKGKQIDIVNTNSWVDGGVASPTPFYWSTDGYGVMWNTFAPGAYDFGAKEKGEVTLTHESPYLDIFVMVNDQPTALLNDFYQLTGNPVLMPKFGFYEGHLNAYNRDYWQEDPNGILFEDGKTYKESQKDNGGIKESLNGEQPGNYQFSARAVIDRYNAHDMPLGWVLPNDGYGAGYGQTSSLDGNIQNLKKFGDYARKRGVEIGLWTQSSLHPKEGIEPLLQRDIVKEVRDAGVRVLKTDVAWVGSGYSFGLNGVADVAEIMPYYGNDARPFIISLDGWAGTQRYAGIWTGDQTGGQWEYIRFHIPTYIGSGLSGQPNISSDMDGIFGGKNPVMNTRDYQWKTWTPMQLNMDGWGANPKYPHIFGGEYEKIVRGYQKLKSELLPYAYTYAREAVDGKPLVRAMFLDYPNDYTHGVATKYQFLYGPDFLVAPIYRETRLQADGTDVRNNIYLPAGTWYDYFTGKAYESDGTVVLNNFDTPLWKLPVFVKAGAIIPMVNPNNNPSQIDHSLRIYEIWPMQGKSEMTEYDDDGTTQAWQHGQFATTKIGADLNAKGVLTVTVNPTAGNFDRMAIYQATELRIPATAAPKQVTVKVNGKKVAADWKLEDAHNRLTAGGVDSAGSLPMLVITTPSINRTNSTLSVEIKGYDFNPAAAEPAMTALTAPSTPMLAIKDGDVKPYDLTVRWEPLADASQVQILHDGMLYTNLGTAEGETYATFEDLTPETKYDFKIRAVNPAGESEWADLALVTAANPLEFAISGIKATATIPDQPGMGLRRAFDLKDGNDIWHSIYSGADMPFDLTIDLGSFNTLDRLEYLPRLDAGNGTILGGTWQVSENGTDWTEPQPFEWQRNADTKVIKFSETLPMRYIRLHVDNTVGRFASAREIFVFKAPGTPSYLPGDINKDGLIDSNDLTSYTNYMGLRRGDGDFDYVSMGDVNRNGLIDACDVSYVATRLDGGIENPAAGIDGELAITTAKNGDEITVTLSGKNLSNVNALSAAIPYDSNSLEYVGIEPVATSSMQNLTYDRLHTSGDKVLYPTFVNLGHKPTLNGDQTIAVIRFKARKKAAVSLTLTHPILVAPAL